MQQGQTGAVTGSFQKEISRLALLMTVRAVIQLDGADKREVGRMAEQIVKMLAADLVEVLLPFALAESRLRGQHIGHPHLGQHPGLVAYRQIQNPEKRALGRSEERLLQIIGQLLLLLVSAPENRQHQQGQQQ